VGLGQRLVRVAALVLAFSAALTVVQAAQSTANTCELHGTVTDETGGVIVGATVALRTGTRQTTTVTDPQGHYAFDNMNPGRYTLTATFQGFLIFTADVELRPQVATSLDIGLKVAMSVLLEVRDMPGLSTDPRKNLSAVVLTGRDLEALPDDPQLFMLRILEMAGSTGRPGEIAVYVDGFREYKRLPPKNTIEVVRINSNPFSAEFSQPSIKRIEITTKPGSDSFHGDVRLQARAGALDARSPLAETNSEVRYRNYNGYLQGPIAKTRLGFLIYAGQWRQDDNAFVNATVLDGRLGIAQPFSAVVSTPITVTSAMVKTDIELSNQLLNVSYTRTSDTRRNQGLQSGFDLPEHAYDHSSNEDVGRLWWTSIGRRVINDVRLEVNRSVTDTRAQSATPALLVLDAFMAGGNQSAASRGSTRGIQASESVMAQRGRHVFKTGALFETTSQSSTDRSGFGGTFIFGADVDRDANGNPTQNEGGVPTSISPIEHYRRTLLGLPGYSPSQFSIVRGSPNVAVGQWSLGWFALDDWSPSKRLTLSVGVRQELQNNIARRVNLAPRAALSWLLDQDGKNAIKLGTGVFYDRVPLEMTLQSRRLNGVDRQQFVVQRPAFFTSIPGTFESDNSVHSSVYTKSTDLRAPHSVITSIGYERQLPWHLFGLVQYLAARGVNLLRLRDITSPDPGVVNVTAGPPVLQFESTGRSFQHEVMLALRGNITGALTLYGNYRFGTKDSDTDGAYTIPANSRDLSTEYGRSADDQRHQFLGGVTAQSPHGILFDSSISIASGRPFNITSGLDNNGDTLFTDRPAFAKAGDVGAITTPFGVFNPNPHAGDNVIPRNFGHDPSVMNVRLALSKVIATRVLVTIDVDNLLNTSRFFGSNGIVTSPVFGLPNQALNPRRIELTIRYGF
jgi:hypothetical protein